MANPFLVLGGIAVGIVTAGFGILQVPGWVASAQDAAAVNDIAMVASAQAVAVGDKGRYQPSIAALASTDSTGTSPSFAPSSGVQLLAAADPTGKHALTVARSASGKYFAKLSGGRAIGSGASVDEAVTSAGTTISAGITAQGIPVPRAYEVGEVVSRNLITNPSFEGPTLPTYNRVTGSISTAWAADGERSLALTRTSDTSADAYAEVLGMVEGGGVAGLKPNTTYTLIGTYNLSAPMQSVPTGATSGLAQRLSMFVHLNGRQLGSVEGVNSVGERTLTLTFTTPASLTGFNTIRLYAGDTPGAPQRVSWDRIGLYEGTFSANDWYTGDSAPRNGLTFAWAGEPHKSASIAYR